MTEADLAGIESALGVTFPDYYREFMLEYPADLLAARYGPDGEPGEPADDWLHWRPETVIRENQAVRDYLGSPGWDGKTDPWPPNWFVIANNGGGDHWYIDLTARPGMEGLVWKFDHESGRRFVAAGSLQGWAEHLRNVFEMFERGEF